VLCGVSGAGFDAEPAAGRRAHWRCTRGCGNSSRCTSYTSLTCSVCGIIDRAQAQRIPFVDIFDRTPQQSTNKRKAAVLSVLKGPSTPKKPRQQPVEEDEYGCDDCC
jgi:hypothetical protein